MINSKFLNLVKFEWRFLLYGLLMSLWSSFGQTFFISLFSSEIRNELQLSHGEFGAYYAIATTVSAKFSLDVNFRAISLAFIRTGNDVPRIHHSCYKKIQINERQSTCCLWFWNEHS